MAQNTTALIFEDEADNTLEFEMTPSGDVRVIIDDTDDGLEPAVFVLNRRSIVRLTNFLTEELSA
jgi:hypothetical protein